MHEEPRITLMEAFNDLGGVKHESFFYLSFGNILEKISQIHASPLKKI
jgi:hypothetical protein